MIARGDDCLIAAPTGSGKTLAAFLACLDRLVRADEQGGLENRVEVLYVSPRKALSNDVQKNFEVPSAEIAELARGLGRPTLFCKEVPGIREEELYQPRPPTVDEVYKFVKIAAGFTSNAQVVEMFVAKRMNGYPDPLIDFVLSR